MDDSQTLEQKMRFVRILWRWVIPLALFALAAGATWMSVQRSTCTAYCAAHGFASARYTPPGRQSTPQRCHCLTQAESEMTQRVPPGTEVDPWTK